MHPGRVVCLPKFSVIVAEGADAAQFLQSQFTNGLEALRPDQHQLTGYCSAKGRLLAIARLWRIAEDRIGLVLPTDIAPAVVKRLGMFVLRAKVRLSLAQAQVEGLWFASFPPDSVATSDAAPEVGLVSPDPSDPHAFLLWLGAKSVVAPTDANTAAGVDADWSRPPVRALRISFHSADGRAENAHDWDIADIRAGLPWIWAPTQDLFVPQMVNLELLGGVNFQKGCYPGQEVVARSQYLGKLNRRMFGVSFALPAGANSSLAAPGSKVFSPTDPSQPCGSLVAGAPAESENPAGPGSPTRYLGLVSVSLDAWAQGGLRLLDPESEAEGPSLEPFALPYPVPTTPQTPNRPKL